MINHLTHSPTIDLEDVKTFFKKTLLNIKNISIEHYVLERSPGGKKLNGNSTRLSPLTDRTILQILKLRNEGRGTYRYHTPTLQFLNRRTSVSALANK